MLLPLLLTSLASASEGTGRATLVWLQAEPPSEDLRQKAEKLIGSSAVHASWGDIAFPAAAFGKDDEARFAALDRAGTDARAKWDAFDAEREIAAGLGTAVSAVDVIRNEADRKLLASALLLQGAAALRIVPESDFATAEPVAGYRTFVGSSALVRPFVDALAIEPDGVWTRDDVLDGSAFTRLGAERDATKAAGKAKLEVAAMPGGVALVVDGRPLDPGATSAEIGPGKHYVHALVGGRISGRRVLDAVAGATVPFEPTVSRGELDAASARVLEGNKEIPEDVATAATAVGTRNGALTPTFLATLDDKGKVQVLPYAGGAAFQKRAAVTVLLSGSVGGAVVNSSAFVGSEGTAKSAWGVGGNLGAEVGIYNLALYGGSSLVLTPGDAMRFAVSETENTESNAYFQPYGGVGLYLPRPDAKKVLVLLGAHYAWMSPGAQGVGGRVAIGLPSGDGTWFRIELDGLSAVQMPEFDAEGTPTSYAAVRLGFGRKL